MAKLLSPIPEPMWRRRTRPCAATLPLQHTDTELNNKYQRHLEHERYQIGIDIGYPHGRFEVHHYVALTCLEQIYE